MYYTLTQTLKYPIDNQDPEIQREIDRHGSDKVHIIK